MRAALLAFIGTAMWVATKQCGIFRDCFFGALRGRGHTDEQIADLLGIGRAQLADQKALRAQMSIDRILGLPLSMQIEIFGRYLRTMGVIVFEDSMLGEFLAWQVSKFKKRQVKMALTAAQKAEVA